jgi:hypothetical protein
VESSAWVAESEVIGLKTLDIYWEQENGYLTAYAVIKTKAKQTRTRV